jgi:diacylglycerol O-acyltransferase
VPVIVRYPTRVDDGAGVAQTRTQPMPALSALDLAMFLLESPERPFNIGPLVLLRPPPNFRGSFADKLTAKMLQRPVGAPFSYRLQLSLRRAPSVVPVADPDPRPHVHRLTLEHASTEALLKKVCELHEPVLDRAGMLWRFWVIDGLADGRIALYAKVHHGLIDGRGFVRAVTQWLSEDPKERTVRALWEGLPARSAGHRRDAGLLASLQRSGGQAAALLKSAAGVYGLLAEQGLRAAGAGQGTTLPFLKVPDAFGGALSAQRVYAYGTLPLARMKALGKAHGATINDLLLTVVDHALNRDLAERGAASRRALVADMPVALGDAAKGGNQIAVLQFPLGAPKASLRDRLAAVRAETAQLKTSLGKRGGETAMLYTTLVHALPLLFERVARNAAPRLANLLISNPFGLPTPRYLMGAPVEAVLPISLVSAGHKLNVTAVTLGDSLQIGFLAMPEAVPRIAQLARFTEEAFNELEQVLGVGSQAAAAAGRARGRKAAARGAASRQPGARPPAEATRRASRSKPANPPAPAPRRARPSPTRAS